jgi:hypothetical protein
MNSIHGSVIASEALLTNLRSSPAYLRSSWQNLLSSAPWRLDLDTAPVKP